MVWRFRRLPISIYSRLLEDRQRNIASDDHGEQHREDHAHALQGPRFLFWGLITDLRAYDRGADEIP